MSFGRPHLPCNTIRILCKHSANTRQIQFRYTKNTIQEGELTIVWMPMSLVHTCLAIQYKYFANTRQIQYKYKTNAIQKGELTIVWMPRSFGLTCIAIQYKTICKYIPIQYEYYANTRQIQFKYYANTRQINAGGWVDNNLDADVIGPTQHTCQFAETDFLITGQRSQILAAIDISVR